ncbi:extracellular glycosidase Crh11p [[Candida] railenensis]|uniref:Crh-like protein n=1 Tax=[Candida] railenensis TaxID=45579 RepID=A0A9P0VZN8_9ASCO|nr:extracellular glycosidase Crh11p [[Candida] railenensis]
MLKSLHPLLFIISLVAATTTTSCNPLSSTSCPTDPALGKSIEIDFSEESSYFNRTSGVGSITYDEDAGVTMTLAKRYDNPALKSNFYIMFGRVEVHMKAGNGTGIISSFYLQSDDLDEIDIELFGSDTTQFQSNFFSKGNTTTYDRGVYSNTPSSPQDSYLNYTIVWTSTKLEWWLEGTLTRTLLSTNSEGFPQTPMFIETGIWAGGDASNAEGTIEWAGGSTDYSQAPFSMSINKLLVEDYSTGTSYSYGDTSGDWTSIESNGGTINGSESSDSSSDSESSSSTSTKTTAKTTSSSKKATTTSKTSSEATTSKSDSDLTSSTEALTKASAASGVTKVVADASSSSVAGSTSALVASTTLLTSTSSGTSSTSVSSSKATVTTSSSGSASTIAVNFSLLALIFSYII